MIGSTRVRGVAHPDVTAPPNVIEAPDTEDVSGADGARSPDARRTWPWWQKTLVIAGCVLLAFTGAGVGLAVWDQRAVLRTGSTGRTSCKEYRSRPSQRKEASAPG